jgi:hypothetical protein
MLLVYRLAQLYAAFGVLAAAGFLGFGIDRVAPSARGAYAFRPLLLPGLVLLWPLVLWRWLALAQPAPSAFGTGRHYRGAHRAIWLLLAILLPLLLVASIALRQDFPSETPPVRLAAPESAP